LNKVPHDFRKDGEDDQVKAYRGEYQDAALYHFLETFSHDQHINDDKISNRFYAE